MPPKSAPLTFPLPDNIATPTTNRAINISDFISNPPEPFQPPQTLPQPPATPSIPPPSHPPLLTPLISALQHTSIPKRTPPISRPIPTFSEILTKITTPPPSRPLQPVITVSIYDPNLFTKSLSLLLHPSTPLTTLIDAIPCPTPHPQPPSNGTLFINDVFYPDTRHNTVDYVTPLLTHLRLHNPPTRQFSEYPHPNPLVKHLSVIPGFPYVYCHRGNCHHLLIFTDLFWRPVPSNASPVFDGVEVVSRAAPRVIPCDVCRVRAADRFVVADLVADTSPFQYCERCFQTVRVGRDGRRFAYARGGMEFEHHAWHRGMS